MSSQESIGPETILLVDDSEYWTETVADLLRREGYAVSVLHDGLTAVERLRKSPPNILITDYFLANLDGGKLCQIAKHVPVTPPISTIILTGGADRKHSRAPSEFADAVIAKNTTDIVFADLRRALRGLGETLPPPGEIREVIGHERLAPRVIASKLHGLKQYLDALHEGIGDAVIGVDAQLRVYFLNSVALDLFDVAEEVALAQPFDTVLRLAEDHPLVARVRTALDTGGAPRAPLTLEIDQATLRVTVAGLLNPDGQTTAMVIARDISDLKAAEQARLALDAKLHEADKMASLGQLVAGVSHEINNPLAAILLNLHTLEDTYEAVRKLVGPKVKESDEELPEIIAEAPKVLEESLEAAERIRAIVAEMRLFAHPKSESGEVARIEELLDAALTLAGNEIRFKAKVERAFGETPVLVVDRNRLSQAFLNVILNAIQALEGADPYLAWIRVGTRVENDGVVVEIANSGPRIAKDVQSRIFDPFFTTKPVGQGLGLGLSITYETARRHGGFVEVLSDDQTPTTFRFWLPRNTGLALAPEKESRLESTPARPAHVLIVDDERLLRNSLKRILERDHEVTVASSGQKALELLTDMQFDVVLCDLIMPGMTGMQLYDAVRERSPDQAARFVFLTGGTSSPEARDFLRSVSNPRAYKPLQADDLARLVRRCLSEFAPKPE